MAKLRYIVVLMVASQLLLTVFLVKWIGTQYSHEKTILQKDIQARFNESKQEMTDSAIFHKYILPITGDSSFKWQGKGKTALVVSNFSGNSDVVLPGMRHHRIEEKTTIRVEVKDSSARLLTHDIQGMVPGKEKMMNELVTGLRMFIAKGPGDSTAVDIKYDMQLAMDTAVLKKAFDRRMKDFTFAYAWKEIKDGKNEGLPPFYFSSENGKIHYGALVEGTNVYLLKRITPQLLFAALLILLTTFAFVFSYRSMRSQQRLNTMRTEFISNMSHELKTPLATAKVTIEALKTYETQKRMEAAGEYLDIAYNELNRLDALVNDVLNASIMESGQVKINLEKTNLDELIQQAVRSFHIRSKQTNAQIIYNSPGAVYIMADALHVQGVITNLIDNGIKYNDKESPVLNIEVETANGKTIVKISDNGPGIPAEYKDKVFDKFFRIPAYNKHNVKGYGLGLNYAKIVMEQHGEIITVANNAGEGCTFTLSFKSA